MTILTSKPEVKLMIQPYLFEGLIEIYSTPTPKGLAGAKLFD